MSWADAATASFRTSFERRAAPRNRSLSEPPSESPPEGGLSVLTERGSGGPIRFSLPPDADPRDHLASQLRKKQQAPSRQRVLAAARQAVVTAALIWVVLPARLLAVTRQVYLPGVVGV